VTVAQTVGEQNDQAPHANHSQLKLFLQAANVLCVLMFIYTMYKVCGALDEMQLLTKEALFQNRQQQELFKEMIHQFKKGLENTADNR
jgi:hypothetical protein